MMDAVDYLEDAVGVARACAVMGVNRARVYRVRERRRHLSGAHVPRRPRPGPPLALTAEERAAVLQVLNSNRFADMHRLASTPRCSTRTATFVRCAPCTGCWLPTARSANAVTS